MNLGLLFLKFLPLLLYVLVDYWKGFKAGIVAAIAGCVVMCIWDYATLGKVDGFSIGETALIVVLGFISLKMNNEKFFKFQPTVLAAVYALIMIYFELRHDNLFLRYLPEIEKLINADGSEQSQQMLANLHSPEMHRDFVRVSRLFIVVFISHALIMAYAAVHWSTPRWFAWRLAIYPGLFLAFIVAMMMH